MSLKKILAALCGLAAILTLTIIPANQASAASLTEITGFGTNPTGLRMHLYVPASVRPAPPVLVAVHYCTGSGPAFYSGTEFASLADRYGFVVIYPSATRSGQCFDVSTPQSLKHDGSSDPVGIVSMVKYVVANQHADPARVYVTGASSGAMMTNVLLGDYPDVFKAGAAFAGVPFGCFATTDGSLWNSACANGQISKTPAQWGDLVRAAYPGYSGPRPRMQLWHGTDDATLHYPNFGEAIKQWTNVSGVSQTPTSTDHPQPTWTRTRYGSAVEAISLQGVGHNVPQSGMAAEAIRFFGLDSETPPTTTTTPTTPTTTTSTPPPAGGCAISYGVNAWNTGFTAGITIANTGSTAVDGWSLAFTLPAGQTITGGWGATYVPTSGAVTATNVSYDGMIPPGSSTTVGFQATHTGNAAAPTSFTLNGKACSTR